MRFPNPGKINDFSKILSKNLKNHHFFSELAQCGTYSPKVVILRILTTEN